MKITFTFAFFLLGGLAAQAQTFFQPAFGNNERAILKGRNYVFFGHATAEFDQDHSSEPGTRRLLAFAQAHNIPTIAGVQESAFASEREAADYFVRGSEITYVLNSYAGQHELSFPQLDNMFFSGGNITLCLCEGVRDVVRGTRVSTKHPVNLILVRDAIYDWSSSFDPITENSMDEFITQYLLPSFRCPGQNWYNFPNMVLSDIKMTVFFDGMKVKDYDLEPNDGIPLEKLAKTINLRFTTSQRLQGEYPTLVGN